jgi:hypothetical protein
VGVGEDGAAAGDADGANGVGPGESREEDGGGGKVERGSIGEHCERERMEGWKKGRERGGCEERKE